MSYKHRGYILVKQPDHPFAQKQNGYISEHRLVMEKKVGRYIYPWEVVHHINYNRSDNRPENLWLTTKQVHDIMHRSNLQPHKRLDMSKRYCKLCGSNKTYMNTKKVYVWHHYNDGFICDHCRGLIRYKNAKKLTT